jgi:hypothetical protein
MKVTVSITPRPWWKRLGIAGTLLVWAGLRAGFHVTYFFRVEAK